MGEEPSEVEMLSTPTMEERIQDTIRRSLQTEAPASMLVNDEEELRNVLLNIPYEQLRLHRLTEQEAYKLVAHEREHYQKAQEIFGSDSQVTFSYAVEIMYNPFPPNSFSSSVPRVTHTDTSGDRSEERKQWYLQQTLKVTSAPTELSESDLAFLRRYRKYCDSETLQKWGDLIEGRTKEGILNVIEGQLLQK